MPPSLVGEPISSGDGEPAFDMTGAEVDGRPVPFGEPGSRRSSNGEPGKNQPSRRPQATEIMMVARRMADEMANHLAGMNNLFRDEPANRDRLELLASEPAQRILGERLARLLDLDEWSRADLMDLSSLTFLMATTTED